MLTTITITAAALLIGAALVQGAIAIYFQRWFFKKEVILPPAGSHRHAAVIMSVRGCDPFLQCSLVGILNQEYDSYEVHLIVDHRTDQAWDFVHEIKALLDDRDVLKIHEMRAPSETCSLKCHAIVQALEYVSPRSDLIALLDADVTPHPTWLQELTGPLMDPAVGGVTGNQWFEPRPWAGLGAITRSTWNGGALVPTILFTNPWAGSFAMRSDDLKKSGLAGIWSQSVVDDGPIQQAINAIGLRIEFAPSLIMVNRESCSFGFVNRWVTRMLTWSRLYENTFFLSVIHAGFSNFVMLANFGLLFTGVYLGDAVVVAISAIALLVSGILSTTAYVAARNCVARSCRLRGVELAPLTVGRFIAVVATIAVAHLIYGISCTRALFIKRINWRDITYEVNKHDDIKRLNYEPYVPAEARSKMSI